MVKDILSYGIGTLASFVLLGALRFVFIRDVTQKKHSMLRKYRGEIPCASPTTRCT
jgi:hypothetical protein